MDEEKKLVRLTSLPLYQTSDPPRRTLTGTEFPKALGMTLEQQEKKRAEFEENIKKYLKEKDIIVEQTTSEGISEEEIIKEGILDVDVSTINDKVAKFYYFIGRLNPPHDGHIDALTKLVIEAKKQGSIPLILLGSGPNGGARTMDNPITFDFKKEFIESKLFKNIGARHGVDYIIEKMTNPAGNVSNYVTTRLQELGENLKNIKSVDFYHIAGGKDDDATKLGFVGKSLIKKAAVIVPGATASAHVKEIEAVKSDSSVEAMSATKVRKDAYRTLVEPDFTKQNWLEKYGDFYGDFAERIYNEILFPLEEIPAKEKEIAIQNYILTGALPLNSDSNTKKQKKGTLVETTLDTQSEEVGVGAKRKKKKGGTKRKSKKKTNKIKRKRRFTRGKNK